MQITYNIILVLAILVALFFVFLVLLTGKGDAMSGGSSIRTTYRGKASFEDYMSRLTLALGAGFIVCMIVLNFIGARLGP